MEILIKQCNKNVLHKNENSNRRLCNCTIKKSCLLNSKFLEACIVCKVKVSTEVKCALQIDIIYVL